MTAGDVFKRVIGVLDRTENPYMLTGSFASSFHGVPRSTQDIDIVITPTADQIRALVESLPESEYYVDLDAAENAKTHEGQFNVLDFATGWKMDFIVRKSRPFSRLEFERKSVVDFNGLALYIASAEDVCIAELEWAKLGESSRQVEDAAGILRVRGNELDLEYIHKWVDELDLTTQWVSACRLAEINPG